MNFSPEVEFREDLHLLIYRPRGIIDESAINKVLSALGDLEAATQAPFDRFTDTLASEEIELNFRYVIHVSLFRRLTYAGRPHVKSAILATDSAMLHYGRLHALLTQGSSIDVRVFQKREEAAAWLGLPIGSLLPKGKEQARM